jgi:hypothetical protein
MDSEAGTLKFDLSDNTHVMSKLIITNTVILQLLFLLCLSRALNVQHVSILIIDSLIHKEILPNTLIQS